MARRGRVARLALRCWPGLLVAALSGCIASAPSSRANPGAPADRFLAALAASCGQAFAGRVLVDTPATATPRPFAGKALVMHVRGCEEPTRTLRVPFSMWATTIHALGC